MATNKLGPGTVNIGVNVPKELRAQLEQLAAACRPPKKLSAYVREVLEASAKEGVVYEQVEQRALLVAEEKSHYDSKSSKKQAG